MKVQKWMWFLTTVVVLLFFVGACGAQTKPKTTAPLALDDLSNYQLMCQAADGKSACSVGDLKELNAMILSGRSTHKLFATIASVRLKSPDGTLKCSQTNGKPCTLDQLHEIHDAIAAQTTIFHVISYATVE